MCFSTLHEVILYLPMNVEKLCPCLALLNNRRHSLHL